MGVWSGGVVPLEHPQNSPQPLSTFPHQDPPLDNEQTLYRIFRNRDPETGDPKGPFWFASVSTVDSGSRYDLEAPAGSCYFALSPLAAWLEVFRTTRIVNPQDLRHRRLSTSSPSHAIDCADLTHPQARGFGVTGEIHTTDDYELPRAWAGALHATGFHALRGKIRHDPQLKLGSVTVFDKAGAHPPFHRTPNAAPWTATETRLETDSSLLNELRDYGIKVAGIPYDVATIDPPTP